MTFVYALWPNHWQVLKMTITSLADPEFPVGGANTPPPPECVNYLCLCLFFTSKMSKHCCFPVVNK